jgi:coatomer protein complex subunit epsilon
LGLSHTNTFFLSDHPSNTANMDPFSSEGELLNLYNHFQQGQYDSVVSYDTSTLSPENVLIARVLSLRAQVALGNAEDVIADVEGEKDPELAAAGAYAEYAAGNKVKALNVVGKLAESEGDNSVVQILGGTVLQAEGKTEEALALLGKHQGNRMLDLALQCWLRGGY